MSLVTYAEARPWARSIKARVADHQMPPWHIDKTVGVQKFKNDRSLTDEQIDTIVKWVDAGAPQGDPKDMPAPEGVARGSGLELRGAVRPEGAGPDRQVVQTSRCRRVSQDAWDKRVTPSRHHRAALGARDRDPSRDGQGPQDHAPRHRVSRAGRSGRAAGGWPARRRSWNGRSASRAR